jgi:hypothetical protein
MVPSMSTKETLLSEINAFLARHSMRAADFGKFALNDTGFVYRLRQDLDPKASTVDRCRSYMVRYDREHPLDRKRKKAAEQRSAA